MSKVPNTTEKLTMPFTETVRKLYRLTRPSVHSTAAPATVPGRLEAQKASNKDPVHPIIGSVTLRFAEWDPQEVSPTDEATLAIHCSGIVRRTVIGPQGAALVNLPITHIDSSIRVQLFRKSAVLGEEYVGQYIVPLSVCVAQGHIATEPLKCRWMFFPIEEHVQRYTAAVPMIKGSGVDRPKRAPSIQMTMTLEMKQGNTNIFPLYLQPAASSLIFNEQREFHPNTLQLSLLRLRQAWFRPVRFRIERKLIFVAVLIILYSPLWLIPLLLALLWCRALSSMEAVPLGTSCADVIVFNDDKRLIEHRTLYMQALELYEDLGVLQGDLHNLASVIEKFHNIHAWTSPNVTVLVIAVVTVGALTLSTGLLLFTVLLEYVNPRYFAVYGFLYAISPYVRQHGESDFNLVVRDASPLEAEPPTKFWEKLINLYEHIPTKVDMAHEYICSLQQKGGHLTGVWVRGSGTELNKLDSSQNLSSDKSVNNNVEGDGSWEEWELGGHIY